MWYNEGKQTSTYCNELQFKFVAVSKHIRWKRQDERFKSSNRSIKARSTTGRMAAADTSAAGTVETDSDGLFVWLNDLPVSGVTKLAKAVQYCLNEKP